MSSTLPGLLPAAIVDVLVGATALEFRRQFAGVLFLVVDVGGKSREFVEQLEQIAELDGDVPRIPDAESLSTLEMTRIDLSADPADLAGSGGVELLARLSNSRHFILPLLRRRRRNEGNTHRVHVGRAPDNDVVLAHPSVSASHAWFERDASGILSLFDAGSKNGTHVNAQRVERNQQNWIQPMDHIQFGAVSSFTCAPNVLRGVLRTK